MKLGASFWKRIRRTLGERHDPAGLHTLADLYWRSLLAAAFAVLVLVFLYSTWGLWRILEDLDAAQGTSATPASVLNRTDLNATIQSFDGRKVQFDTLKAGSATPIRDPSI